MTSGADVRLWGSGYRWRPGWAAVRATRPPRLVGLNALWRLGLNQAELGALGAELGSDVPFFLPAPPPGVQGAARRWKPSP